MFRYASLSLFLNTVRGLDEVIGRDTSFKIYHHGLCLSIRIGSTEGYLR